MVWSHSPIQSERPLGGSHSPHALPGPSAVRALDAFTLQLGWLILNMRTLLRNASWWMAYIALIYLALEVPHSRGQPQRVHNLFTKAVTVYTKEPKLSQESHWAL